MFSSFRYERGDAIHASSANTPRPAASLTIPLYGEFAINSDFSRRFLYLISP